MGELERNRGYARKSKQLIAVDCRLHYNKVMMKYE